MSLTTIYTVSNIKADMILIGNTLGLAKDNGTLTPGTLGSIGAFITTDSTSQAPGWPPNTTLNWEDNSSTAELKLPPNSTVIKALLFWCADYINGAINLTSSIPNAVTLTDPSGTAHPILPGNSIGVLMGELGENARIYQNYTDVTTIVNNGGNGTWTCGGVPCALNPASDNLNFAGWALQVAYTNASFKLSNIVIQVGPNFANDFPIIATVNYGGPPLKLYATIGYADGDAILSNDFFTVGGVALSGSNNPSNNIFCSQINYPDQTLNTSGLFGTVNANPVTATNTVGCRQGWDVMKVPVSLPSAAGTTSSDITTNNDPGFIYTLGFVSQSSQPSMVLTKSVDKPFANNGDTLTYTIVLNNTIQAASNAIIFDTIPVGASFIPGTVKLNTVTLPSANPQSGITLGTVPISTVNTITFKVKVSPPFTSNAVIDNIATTNYTYTTIPLSSTSNDVLTTIVNPTSLTKTVSENYATLGDILTYTIAFSNFATNTISNIILIDTTPNGTSVVPNSIFIDGVPNPASSLNSPGIALSNLLGLGTSTITFKVQVNTIPSSNPTENQGFTTFNNATLPSYTYSNIVSTTISAVVLSSSKIVNKSYANVGDILTYTIPIKNNGNISASNILFIDTIPNGTILVANSFKQDSTLISGSPNAPGVTLPNIISPLSTTTISFQVQITTIPSPNPIVNSASATSSFTVDSTTTPNRVGKSSTNSNIVNTKVNNANLGNISKSVDKAFVTCGEVLTYTITIPNIGSAAAINVIFKDTIPNGTTLVPNTVTVNGLTQPVGTNPQTGINLGTIPAGNTTIVTFKVQVNC